VNTVVFSGGRSVGHNTDFSGYITGLRATLPEADLAGAPAADLQDQFPDQVVTARARGCEVVDGGTMAVGQAVDAFGLITGHDAEADRMRSHFLQLVAERQG
jgi:shikimate 5-dehydrogenase